MKEPTAGESEPQWTRLMGVDALEDLLGVPLSSDWGLLSHAVPELPGASQWWQVTPLWTAETSATDISLGLQVVNLGHGFDTVHFSLTGARKSFGDLAVLALDYLFGRLPSPATAVKLTRQLLANLATLDADEAEVVAVIRSLVGGNPYAGSASEARLRAAYADASVSLDDLLASLERKQVVARQDGLVRLAV